MHTAIIILAGALGAVATFLLQRYGISAVVASSLVGLSGAGIGFLMSDSSLPAVIFAGSFVGMTALHLASVPLIVVGGVGVGVLYLLTEHMFQGYGGKLGTIAFISTVIVLWVASFFSKK